MAEVHENIFIEGTDTDNADELVSNKAMRSSMNVRVTNKDGDGFIAASVRGNELKFNLNTGKVPLGSAEFNGILYIISVDPDTGEGEIGTFPSPVQDGLGGWNDTYAPLRNWTGVNEGDPREDFSTTLFGFDCAYQCDIEVRPDYDTSVNIYWADGLNPLRSVNSGFLKDGVYNDTTYYEGSFPSGIEVLFESKFHPIFNLDSIEGGGTLKAGVYFWYARYTTQDFNRTSFLGESGPCQCSIDPDQAAPGNRGGEGLENSDKSIKFTVSGLDPDYEFLELAYSYHYDGQIETGLIDQFYDISDNTGSIQITITGGEPVIETITLGDIITRKINDDIPQCIGQFENRLWMGNLKTRKLYDPLLTQLALEIIAEPSDVSNSERIRDETFSNPDINFNNCQYKNWRNTYEKVGYFRGETYAFAIVFVDKGGRESEPFPVTGGDYYALVGPPTLNDQGIVRMPSNQFGDNPFYEYNGGVDPDIVLQGITFNMGNAYTFYQSTPAITTYFDENIHGWYFVRAERNPNLLYQGMVSNVWRHDQLFGNADEEDQSPNQIAAYGTIPSGLGTQGQGVALPWTESNNNGALKDNKSLRTDGYIRQLGKFGIFSSDHHFNKNFSDGTYAVVPQARFKPFEYWDLDLNYNTSREPSAFFDVDFISFDHIIDIKNEVGEVDLYNVLPWQASPNNLYVSKFNTGENGSSPGTQMFYAYDDSANFQVYNRFMGQRRYIGMDNADSPVPVDPELLNPMAQAFDISGLGQTIVNIYNQSPSDVVLTDTYQVKSTEYFKIHSPQANGIILWESFQGPLFLLNINFFRGDCFVQRTYFKEIQNPDAYNLVDGDDFDSFDHFGKIYSVVTENAFNIAMRQSGINVDDNISFPEYSTGSPLGAMITRKRENEDLNIGYNQQVSPNGKFGYNAQLPLQVGNYETRVRYSNFHQNSFFTDNYKKFDIAAYQDFDYRLGPITELPVLGARMALVQEEGLGWLHINERQLAGSADPSEGSLVLGTGDVLASKTTSVTDQYGSQHRWSIVRTERAIYGADYNKRKLWRLTGQGVEMISDTKSQSVEMLSIMDQINDESNIQHPMLNSPICSQGISSGYNKKYSEVVWSFVFGQESSLKTHTVVYNELIDRFVGKHSYVSPMYFLLNEDFFSVDPTTTPSGNGTGTSTIYIHDTSDLYHHFYGVVGSLRLKVLVNANSQVTKVFDNMGIAMNATALSEVSYATEQQQAVHTPWVQPLYLNPKYEENIWRLPIKRADTVDPGIYLVGSRLRGKYMEVELEYTGTDPIFIRSLLTYYRISRQ